MNVSPAIVNELEAVCSIAHLSCEDEPHQFLPTNIRKPRNGPMDYVTPTNHNLQCLKRKEAVNENRAQLDCVGRKMLKNTHKYGFPRPNLLPSGTEAENVPTRPPEFILLVTLYQPYTKRELKMEQQLLVLGSQKLTALRDKFVCLADISVTDDLSENPDLSDLSRAKEMYTSGLFYINGTLYDDMRNPQSRANSRAIVEWADQYPDMGIGPFETKLMEETRFVDLKLRLGYPYLYQHQGDCEHLMVFQDIRLMSGDDCQDVSKYPIVTRISSRMRVVCMVCHLLTAKWITTGNLRLPADPFFYCDACFRQFNYDQEGKKIGQFSAQPFVDRSALF